LPILSVFSNLLSAIQKNMVSWVFGFKGRIIERVREYLKLLTLLQQAIAFMNCCHYHSGCRMDHKVQDLLRKINYIEADIEIQKQILFSIPSDDKQEMERVITIIAAKKEEINTLRREIEHASPDHHEKIMAYENAVAEFRKIAAEKKFRSINGMKINEPCCLNLKNNSSLPCLVKACDENGGWTIITMDGEIQSFSEHEVEEKPEDPLL
jgi:hypothetical protein